jgi:hypothetical protein
MAVEFTKEGNGFQVYCEGTPLHNSTYQDITELPSWWQQCVTPPTDSTWYWREWHTFDASGNQTIKVSGWQADGVRWCGQFECETDDPDYAFWPWVLLQSGCTSDLISETELADLRARFAKTS